VPDIERSSVDAPVLGRWADGLTTEQIEERRERARVWKAANKARHQANSEAYRQRHRDRLAARAAVQVAVANGRMQKQPCAVCGSEEDVQAHHDDYTRKLDVRWLCRRHHAEADVQRRAEEVP
jgi:hypothetical protein